MKRIIEVTSETGKSIYRVQKKHNYLFGLIKGEWYTPMIIINPETLCRIPAEFNTLKEAEKYCGIYTIEEKQKIIKYIIL